MRALITISCGMLLGSIAAFLLYVSLLTVASVVLILVAVMFMFVLGIQVERQRRRVPEIPSEKILSHMHGTHTLLDTSDRSVTNTEAKVRA
jgi:Flp pilus assembly protein TadB